MKELILEMWGGGVAGKFFLGLLAACVAMITAGIIFLINVVGIESEPHKGKITGRHYSPPSIMMISSGKTMVPMTVPASYQAVVEVINIGTFYCKVDPYIYNNARIGDQITAFIGSTRITNDLTCTVAK